MRCIENFVVLLLFVALTMTVPTVGMGQFVSPAPGTATNKASAAPIGPMAAGNTLVGEVANTSTQSTYHLISIESAPLAIYQHRLTFTDQTDNIRAWVRGLSQSGGVVGTTDSAVQTANASSPGFVQWYGFGRSEQFYLQTFGTTTSQSLSFELTMSSTLVTPLELGGALAPGQIRIETTGSATDRRHMHVLDSALEPIPGYQDIDSVSRGLILERDFEPGTYFVAVGQRNIATNLPAPSTSALQNQVVMDFPNVMVAGQPNANATDLSLLFTDSLGGEQNISVTRAGPFDVQWVKFTVVPEPASAVALAAVMVGVAALQRRRAK